jgi:hypothetical protein
VYGIAISGDQLSERQEQKALLDVLKRANARSVDAAARKQMIGGNVNRLAG